MGLVEVEEEKEEKKRSLIHVEMPRHSCSYSVSQLIVGDEKDYKKTRYSLVFE